MSKYISYLLSSLNTIFETCIQAIQEIISFS